MGVRERTNEYGVLRALGFMPKHVRLFIYGEAITLGAIAGTLGAGIGFAFVNFAFGPWLEENMGAMFPYFRVPAEVLIAAFVFAVLLGILAAIIPRDSCRAAHRHRRPSPHRLRIPWYPSATTSAV
jgi:putative ABC transport system permease protein